MNQPNIIAALTAGLVSFISPCVLPLLPAYLSFLSGFTVKELAGRQQRARLFAKSLMFSAGFTLAFTALGIVFSGGMNFIGGTSQRFGIIAGIVVIVLGLNLIFDFIHILNSDTRLIQKFAGKARGKVNAFLLGLAFAAGWSPCIGPILASILLMAARNPNVGTAALLLVAYSAGFALPFIASALFFERLSPLLGLLKRHGEGVRVGSGVLLIAFGTAMILGSVSRISAIAAQMGAVLLDVEAASPLASRLIGVGIWLLFAWLSSRRILWPRKAAPGDGGATPRAQHSPATACIFSATFIVLAVLELAGIISLFYLVGGWLTFSGL
jgi:cytochrome c-type biogenesis protein